MRFRRRRMDIPIGYHISQLLLLRSGHLLNGRRYRSSDSQTVRAGGEHRADGSHIRTRLSNRFFLDKSSFSFFSLGGEGALSWMDAKGPHHPPLPVHTEVGMGVTRMRRSPGSLAPRGYRLLLPQELLTARPEGLEEGLKWQLREACEEL